MVEISDIIPGDDEIRTLYCDECNQSMDLSFVDFHKKISGIQINISNFPNLYCSHCELYYLPDRSAMAIVNIYHQAMAKGCGSVDVNRKKQTADYKFTEIPFHVDADDYYYIPGLYRDFNIGFLSPLYFNITVLSKFNNLPGYSINFASQSYGTIDTRDHYISFGINRFGKVIMWLGDVAELPENEQYYLRSENVISDHSIGSDFYNGQISCIFTDPTKEALAIGRRGALAEAFESVYSTKLFHLDDELADSIFRLSPPIVDTEKDREQIFSTLNKIFVESLNDSGLEKVLRKLKVEQKSSGSLKRLQSIFEEIDGSGAVSDILSPFFVIYDLRIAYSHLVSASRRQELIDSATRRLGVAHNSQLSALYSAALTQVTTSMELLKSLLDKPE